MKTKLVKAIALILSVASIFTCTAFAAGAQTGDINKDNEITNSDLIILARYCVSLEDLGEEEISLADINGDGKVNNTDLISLARKIASNESIPVEDLGGESAVRVDKDFLEPEVTIPVATDNKTETTKPAENKDKTQETATSYTESDLYWLSHIIYAEAGGESFEGMVAVGNVVLNRVKSSKFPNTIYGVIFQKSQFSPASSGSIYRTPSSAAVEAAKQALAGKNVVGNALYFNMVGVNSWASRNAKFVKRIGNHNFYA